MEIDKSQIRKILVIKKSAIGDIVRALPSLTTIAKTFPDASISFLVHERYRELIEPCPFISEIIPYTDMSTMEFVKFARGIRKKKFDLVLNLQNTRRFDILSRISGAPYRTQITEPDRPTKGVDGVFLILKSIGIQPVKDTNKYWFSEDDYKYVEQFYINNELDPGAKLAGLCPGGQWLSKQWPLKGFAGLADILVREHAFIPVIFCGPDEMDRADEIIKMSKSRVLVARDTTIRQAACLASRCRLFVSNDTGLMHFADLLGVPTVGIFGSTNPSYHGPSTHGNRSVFRGVECSPCYNAECTLDFERYYCLTAITAADVYETVLTILKKT